MERELDFYLKNEVLNLDELEAGGQSRSPRWFQMMAVMKAIGCRIITFLAQIEDFQKRIFEKKKFVTEVNYCVTLDRVPEELYPEIIKNKAQTDEWKVIYPDLKEKRFDLALLKNETKLVLDTRYFDPGFVDKLLHSMRSSSDECGLLIHSENYQALNLILRKYFRKVRCIYIDPPFNTGDDFVYKDSFQTSSWITLIKDRIEKSIPLITLNGSYYLHLDENADFLGRMILEKLGFEEIKKITFNTNATTDEEADLFGYKSFGNNFALRSSTIYFLKNIDSVFQKLWKPNRNTTTLSIGWLDLIAKMKSGATGKKIADMDFFVEKWVKGNIALTKIDIPEGEKIYPVSDIWNDIFSFTQSEMRTSENLSFTTQKPENMVRRILQASSLPGDLMLDFFAGSGTSCAVAHKLGRQYIGIEMGHHFYEIYQDYSAEEKRWINKIGLLGRMKIALRGDVNFMAVDKDRRSHLSKDINYSGGGCFKYLSLESYEDALDNISFEATDPQKQLQLDDYVLNYMLNFETRQSATFLNVAKLETPFDYKLHRHGKDEPLPVDLPETFNYLIGLHVATRCVYENKGIRYLVYRGKSEGRETAVIWRTTKGWGQKEFEQDKDFVTKEKLTDGAEDVFVNSDSFIPGARSLDAVFKHRMFNED
ncbi:MAG: DNA methyltransferase [Candidatus Omnitrophota bacterium]